MEYLKRKLTRLTAEDMQISFPHYYEENGRIIKELANGQKWVVVLDENHKEVLLERLK